MKIPVLTLSLILRSCDARSWVQLIDPATLASGAFDPYKVEHSIEKDPFVFTEAYTFPTQAPSLERYEVQDTESPPTSSPSVATAAPTTRDENVLGNGGCAFGKYLYKVRMHDSWGDGWDKTTLTILQFPSEDPGSEQHPIVFHQDNNTVTMSQRVEMNPHDPISLDSKVSTSLLESRLAAGYDGYSYVCLEPRTCYEVLVGGGSWETEVKWDIRSAPVSFFEQDRRNKAMTVAKGLAPAHCQFSIPEEESWEAHCPYSCDINDLAASQAPSEAATSKPTDTPAFATEAPTSTPTAYVAEETNTPTLQRALLSDEPSLVPSTVPSEVVATGFPTAVPNFIPTAAPTTAIKEEDESSGSHPPSDAPSLMPSDVPSSQPSRASGELQIIDY